MKYFYKAKKRLVLALAIWIGLVPNVYSQDTVTVFAASSLTNALSEIAEKYQTRHATKIRFSFASSSALARQIEYGAPADIYFPANQKWLDYVIEKQAVDAKSRVTLLTNRLVLIAPQGSALAANPIIESEPSSSLLDLLAGGRLALGDPEHVPVGQYAKQALNHYQQWDELEPQLARANNVRGALVLVERGESPLGIVYQTDAEVSTKVAQIATFSAESHSPIEYPMVMVSEKPSKSAMQFYQYLQGEEARVVFKQYGFGVNQ
ncbi:molybdate ABC transporter substrate-binding protein [Vibrio amylolyticus]|uniref:molybdate ABC transporter substrate-binding protein n=1 Tax=Vibrio amylolyticus TaxID=2847292 RepID=UPI00354F37D5